MKLQIAIDLVSAREALIMAGQIYDIIDIIEIGTPVIIREGMTAVRQMKAKYPHCTILADTKIVDGGSIEAGDAFEAGADIVTVLALAANETIESVVKTAKIYGRKTMADMICVTDIAKRAKELDQLGLDYICVHTAVDVQSTGQSPYQDLTTILPLLHNSKSAVAGGVNLEAIPLLKHLNPEVIVAGGSLTKRLDLRNAVNEMQAAMAADGSNYEGI